MNDIHDTLDGTVTLRPNLLPLLVGSQELWSTSAA
ncbi:hypothetical protein AZE42_11001, partial [Rhizopogon vesiculosus]